MKFSVGSKKTGENTPAYQLNSYKLRQFKRVSLNKNLLQDYDSICGMYMGLYVLIRIHAETKQNLPENFLQCNQIFGTIAVLCNQDHTSYTVMILEEQPTCSSAAAKVNRISS